MANLALTVIPRSAARKPLSLAIGPQRLDVGRILLRAGGDSRPVNARHVVEIARSISVLGLLEPLVIDTRGQLLAGAHRLVALQLLSVSDRAERESALLSLFSPAEREDPPNAVSTLLGEIGRLTATAHSQRQLAGGVPVLVMDVGSTSEEGGKRALAVELAENTVRRAYTADEIRLLAQRLKAAGYKTSPGRPRPGETSAINVLQAAVGKSRRTIERIIDGRHDGRSDWDKASESLIRSAKRVMRIGGRRRDAGDLRLVEAATRVLQTSSRQG
jgi:ParB family chromosome partitioning protein